ncbi:MAG: RlmE family RNA methyltransferase [Nitrososphaerales archaeon]
MRLSEARRDYYRKRAKEEGYESRAAFKLLEAIKKYRLIRPGDRVIDLGAAPGGWLQVASQAVGSTGIVVGVDLSPIRIELDNTHTLKMDINDPKLAETVKELLKRPADVLLSDLSPRISGVWDLDQYKQIDLTIRSITVGDTLLRAGGNAMFKCFQGERFNEAEMEARKRYDFVAIMKPNASRNASSEMYLLCLGRRP